MTELDRRVRSLLADRDAGAAVTVVLRELGPEVLGFLSGVLGDADGDEVFSALSERLWRSLGGFEGRCSIRTWTYVLARHEITRFRRGMRRHAEGRLPISEFRDILAAARSQSRSIPATSEQRQLAALRSALPIEDRTLLILRIDRNLAWEDIALAFADAPEVFSEREKQREAARLRKRFQLIKQRLVLRVRGAPAPRPE